MWRIDGGAEQVAAHSSTGETRFGETVPKARRKCNMPVNNLPKLKGKSAMRAHRISCPRSCELLWGVDQWSDVQGGWFAKGHEVSSTMLLLSFARH